MDGQTQTPFMPLISTFYDEDDYYTDGELEEPCEFESSHLAELVVGPYVHTLICVLGFLGNSLVIITYACYKRTKSMTDVYLLNVAVADLLFVVALPLIVYNELWLWPMGPLVCKLLRGCYSVNLFSGALLLACISVDRYVAVVQARRSFRLRSLHHSRLVCIAVWAVALLISVPSFHFNHWYQPQHDNDTGYVCEFRFSDAKEAKKTKVALPATQLAVGFFLPLLVMLFCYSAVIATLHRARTFQRHKAVRVVLAVVVVFLVCHLPYNLTLLYDTATMFGSQKCGTADNLHMVKMVTQSLAYLHCCLNPVLYAFVGVKFRNHFKRIVQDLWCLGRSQLGPRRLSRLTSEFYVSTRRSVDGSSENGSSFTM